MHFVWVCKNIKGIMSRVCKLEHRGFCLEEIMSGYGFIGLKGRFILLSCNRTTLTNLIILFYWIHCWFPQFMLNTHEHVPCNLLLGQLWYEWSFYQILVHIAKSNYISVMTCRTSLHLYFLVSIAVNICVESVYQVAAAVKNGIFATCIVSWKFSFHYRNYGSMKQKMSCLKIWRTFYFIFTSGNFYTYYMFCNNLFISISHFSEIFLSIVLIPLLDCKLIIMFFDMRMETWLRCC